MNEETLIKILRIFRKIQPDKNYASRSRGEILATHKIRHSISAIKIGLLDSFKFSGALILASLLIFVVFGGLAFFNIKNLSPVMLTSFNDSKLMAESGDFEIKLQEIEYYERSAQEVATLFDEVLKDEKSL